MLDSHRDLTQIVDMENITMLSIRIPTLPGPIKRVTMHIFGNKALLNMFLQFPSDLE